MRLTQRETKLTSAPRRPMRSPGFTMIARSSFICGHAAAAVCAKFSKTNKNRAPESFIWCSSSCDVYSGLTFTTTPPAIKTPNRIAG